VSELLVVKEVRPPIPCVCLSWKNLHRVIISEEGSCWNYGLGLYRKATESPSKASFTRSGFRPAGRFRLSPDKVVEHKKAQAYTHNPVVVRPGIYRPVAG